MENELGNAVNVETNVDAETSDARVKALEAEIAKLKQSVTNASADASKWKKQYQETDSALKAKMSDEEKARAEQDAATAAMQQELELLRNERNVANHKAQLTAIGFDGDLAQVTAEAINGGDTAKLFDGIRKFIATHDKELQAKSLMNNPVLSGGEAKKTMSKEQFNAMSYKERVELFNTDPELYKEMTKSS